VSALPLDHEKERQMMDQYVCHRLTYTRHRIGTETFQADTDKEARRIATNFVKKGNWLDSELWNGSRRVSAIRSV
jgi:hypothetical protein